MCFGVLWFVRKNENVCENAKYIERERRDYVKVSGGLNGCIRFQFIAVEIEAAATEVMRLTGYHNAFVKNDQIPTDIFATFVKYEVLKIFVSFWKGETCLSSKGKRGHQALSSSLPPTLSLSLSLSFSLYIFLSIRQERTSTIRRASRRGQFHEEVLCRRRRSR